MKFIRCAEGVLGTIFRILLRVTGDSEAAARTQCSAALGEQVARSGRDCMDSDLGRAEGRFHGWGNKSSYDQSYTDHVSSEYIDSYYYSYFVERRRALLMLSRILWSYLWLDVGGGVEDADTKVHSNQSMLLQRAPGRLGSTDFSLLTMALRWDTRDDPA